MPVPGRSRDEVMEAALLSMLAQNPRAHIAAVATDGLTVDLPASLPLGDHRLMASRAVIDLVDPADRPAFVETWRLAKEDGGARVEVRLREAPDHTVTLHYFDVRERHGVFVAVLIADDDRELGAEIVRVPPPPPRRLTVKRDALSSILSIDDAYSTVLGWSPEETIGQPGLDCIHPDDHDTAIDNWVEMLAASADPPRFRCRHLHRDGGWRWMEVEHRYRLDDPDDPHVLSELLDISDEMAAVESLREHEQLLRRLAESLPTGLLQFRSDRTVAYTNERLHEIVGAARTATIDEQLAAVDAADRPVLEAAIASVLDGDDADVEVQLHHEAHDDVRHCQLMLRSLTDPDGRVGGAIVTVADVTESARLRRELERRASYDTLTQCLNRAAVMSVLEDALLGNDDNLAVVYVDLDGFKEVNDALGHGAGDEVLVTMAERLREVIRDHDVVGRLGGDEFLVVCRSVASAPVATEIADRIAAALRDEVRLPAGPIRLQASIGLVHAEPRSLSADQLVARADAAMYESKRAARGLPVVRLLVPAAVRRAG